MNKKLPRVGIVIVNYNGQRYLKCCFNSLSSLNYPKDLIDIIMVDNGSTDNSCAYVRKAFPRVRILVNDYNNYARGNNLGIKSARGKYVVLLNNDTKVDKDWLRELVAPAEVNKHIGAVGSKLLRMDGKVEGLGHKRLPNFYWIDQDSDQDQRDELKEAASLCGCALLLRKDALRQAGYFDEDFNMYFEDVDLSMRLKRKKWLLVCASRSLVRHVHHGTATDEVAWFYSERNRLLLVAKHYPKSLAKALLGRGYFTAQHDIKQQAGIYQILTDIVLKLVQHHRAQLVRVVLRDLFAELKKISNIENRVLVEKIGELINSTIAQQGVINNQTSVLQALNAERETKSRELELVSRAITEKDQLINNQSGAINALNAERETKSRELEAVSRAIAEKDLLLSNQAGEINALKAERETKIRELEAVSRAIAEKDLLLSNQAGEINALKAERETKIRELEAVSRAIAEKDLLLSNQAGEINALKAERETKSRELEAVSRAIAEKDLLLSNQAGEINALKAERETKSRELELVSREITEKDQLINNQSGAINALNAERETKSRELEVVLRALDAFNVEIKALRKEQESLGQAIKEKDLLIHDYIRALNSLEAEQKIIIQANRDKDQVIANYSLELSKTSQELRDVYSSTAFRYIVRPLWSVLWKIRQAVRVPPGASTPQKNSAPADAPKNIPPAQAPGEIGICTIIAKNYLSYARVLAESYLQHNKGKVFVLLTDKVDGYFDPAKEKFTLIEMEALRDIVPEFDKFCFKYNITELSTAIKPFFLEMLFAQYNLSKVIFFDPDILITHELSELFVLLDTYSIVLTPHITRPYPDTHKPHEMDILRSGVFNLGFLALSRGESTRKLLSWWKERLVRYCKIDPQNGLFVDQKWIDLVPGFFKDVFILRDERYNVAYWNLHYRQISMNKEMIFVNKNPAYFVHFSGFNPLDYASISKHQDRFTIRALKSLEPVFELYKHKLISRGYNESKGWPCVYNYFDSGVVIPDFVKIVFWGLDVNGLANFSNPFNAAGEQNFFHWLNEGIDEYHPHISRLMHEVYKKRVDVQCAYPHALGVERGAFLQWFLSSFRGEYHIDPSFAQKIYPFNLPREKIGAREVKTWTYYTLREPIKKFLKRMVNYDPYIVKRLREADAKVRNGLFAVKGAPQKRKISCTKGTHIKGVNLFGYLSAEVGVGEGARAAAKCLKSAGVAISLINIENHSSSRKGDSTFQEFSQDNPYPVNIVHVNADMFPRLYVERGEKSFKGKYTIGFWAWELADFPDEWRSSFAYCDEIWVPSNFTRAAISIKSPLPTVTMPHPIAIEGNKTFERSRFGLNNDELTFLFIFDFFSYFERKNPLAAIQAFKNAFSPLEKARLVIKCANSSFDPAALERLKEAVRGHSITIIDSYLYRDEVNALVSLCDCYVSLHRSEGFGLTIAEAMSLGKPVIATGYSGNMDFMNGNNSYPVKYTLTELENDFGPYKKGNVWADADIAHASELMRSVYHHRDSARKIGEKAEAYIKQHLNYTAVGNECKHRLEHIWQL